MRKLIFLILVACLSFTLVACNSQDEAVEETPPISTMSTSQVNGDLTVYSMGQWTGFNIQDKTTLVYPYYNVDKYVTIRPFLKSANNFWYDFVTAKGKSLQDIKSYGSGVMLLTVGTETFGYRNFTETQAAFAYTNNLPSGYVKLVLEHATIADSD